jgi:hypothetical protein
MHYLSVIMAFPDSLRDCCCCVCGAASCWDTTIPTSDPANFSHGATSQSWNIKASAYINGLPNDIHIPNCCDPQSCGTGILQSARTCGCLEGGRLVANQRSSCVHHNCVTPGGTHHLAGGHAGRGSCLPSGTSHAHVAGGAECHFDWRCDRSMTDDAQCWLREAIRATQAQQCLLAIKHYHCVCRSTACRCAEMTALITNCMTMELSLPMSVARAS